MGIVICEQSLTEGWFAQVSLLFWGAELVMIVGEQCPSVSKVALLDWVLLLPHRDFKYTGGCLAIRVTSSCCVLTVAVNLSIAGGIVLSLLRVVGPVGCIGCVSGSSSSSLLI